MNGETPERKWTHVLNVALELQTQEGYHTGQPNILSHTAFYADARFASQRGGSSQVLRRQFANINPNE